MRFAFILVLLGYGTKAGIAPMHTWKPDAYSEAPVPAAAMLATGVLNCALYGLIRFHVLAARCLGPQFGSQLLIFFGLLSIGVAVPFMLVQKSFRRILAYSSIDHGGIMILGLGFGGAFGALGMLLHMTFHSVTKPLLFFCAGNVTATIEDRSFPPGEGRFDPRHAGDRFDSHDGNARGDRHAAVQPVSERVHHTARRHSGHHFAAAAFCVGFLVAIFAGFLVHFSRLVLGPAPAGQGSACDTANEPCPWKKYSLIGLASIVVILGFWLPRPLFELIRNAAPHRIGGTMIASIFPSFAELREALGEQVHSMVPGIDGHIVMLSAALTLERSSNTCVRNPRPE